MKRIIKAISIGLVFCLALCFAVPDVGAFAKKSNTSSSSSSKSSSSSSSSGKSNSSSGSSSSSKSNNSSSSNSKSNSSSSKNNNSSGSNSSSNKSNSSSSSSGKNSGSNSSGSKNNNSSSSSGSSSSSNKNSGSSSSSSKNSGSSSSSSSSSSKDSGSKSSGSNSSSGSKSNTSNSSSSKNNSSSGYTNDYIPPNSCGGDNHTYAGRTYDSTGHWTNYCLVCGKQTSGYDPSFSGGGSYANGTPRDTSCSHDYVVQDGSRSYLGNGMHSYTSTCRYCGDTKVGSTTCSIADLPATPNTSRDHKIVSQCQWCHGVSATRYESCVWGSNNKCIYCKQEATGRSCSNGVCKDGSATYDPCGCTNFGAAGGCALSLVITWNKQGQNANASIGIGSGTCAWHANNISYVHIANVFHDTVIRCSQGKHEKAITAHAEGSANCSKCAGGHTTSSDFDISTESGWKTDYVTGWQQNNASTHKRTVQEKCVFCGATRNRKTETESHSFTTSSSTSGWEYNSSSHWKTKTKTSTCSVCGYVKSETSRVNEGSHSFTDTYSSWTAGGDGYYHRTKTSSCYCGYTKTSDERGERVHNHVWVSTSGSWYDYDSTRHAKNNWEYCNGTPTPCGETRSLGNSYESHNSSGQRTDNDLSGWLYDDNHNDRHDQDLISG